MKISAQQPQPCPRVSIVVPTLDEAAGLARALAPALEQADEVIVSDGGSRDGTPAMAQRLGARLVSGPAGRGPQLNRGIAAASGDAVLVLHADTRLPDGAIAAVRGALADGAEGGAFMIHFDAEGWVYRFGERMVNWRTRRTRLALGDQAQFATRTALAELGGFRDWPILEDLDFARRLARRGRFAVLGLAVTTSARRFEARGPVRTVAVNWLIWSLFACGVPPRRLARLYRHVR